MALIISSTHLSFSISNSVLKQYNIDSYNKLSIEYKKLLKENNDSLVATDPSKKELENFLANVKLTLLVSENKNDN